VTVTIRPMQVADVEVAGEIIRVAGADLDRRLGRPPRPDPEPESVRMWLDTIRRFVEVDAPGCWVAEAQGVVVGLAVAIRRDTFWGLALLFVHPDHQSTGIGHRLLEAVRPYAEGATLGMIQTSEDTRAARRYALEGFDLHPAVALVGAVDRRGLPAGVPGREGAEEDLELVADVDRRLRGSSRADDVRFLLGRGARMLVVEQGSDRGYGIIRDDRVFLLGADSVAVARDVVWNLLAAVPADREFGFYGLTAAQNWAIPQALALRLEVRPAGPLFIRGRQSPPVAWWPSGVYF
jgi:GNAT superfamily N-acetyltransferase